MRLLTILFIVAGTAWPMPCEEGPQPGPPRRPDQQCRCNGMPGVYVKVLSFWTEDNWCVEYDAAQREECGKGPCNVLVRWRYRWDIWECRAGNETCSFGQIGKVGDYTVTDRCCTKGPDKRAGFTYHGPLTDRSNRPCTGCPDSKSIGDCLKCHEPHELGGDKCQKCHP